MATEQATTGTTNSTPQRRLDNVESSTTSKGWVDNLERRPQPAAGSGPGSDGPVNNSRKTKDGFRKMGQCCKVQMFFKMGALKLGLFLPRMLPYWCYLCIFLKLTITNVLYISTRFYVSCWSANGHTLRGPTAGRKQWTYRTGRKIPAAKAAVGHATKWTGHVRRLNRSKQEEFHKSFLFLCCVMLFKI